jgi:hypothetical protein
MKDEVVYWLEIAQRISNGEAVAILTEVADRLPYYRQIITRDGGTGVVGGAYTSDRRYPPVGIFSFDFDPNRKHNQTVPAVVRYVTTA